MWILRRMMRIPWTARVTNKRVMEMAGVRRELMGVVRKRQLKLLGRLLRHDCLEKDVFLWKIEGRTARGRQRIKFATSLVEDIPGEMTVARFVRMAQDRNRRRFMVAHVNQDTALRQGKVSMFLTGFQTTCHEEMSKFRVKQQSISITKKLQIIFVSTT